MGGRGERDDHPHPTPLILQSISQASRKKRRRSIQALLERSHQYPSPYRNSGHSASGEDDYCQASGWTIRQMGMIPKAYAFSRIPGRFEKGSLFLTAVIVKGIGSDIGRKELQGLLAMG